MAVMAAPGNRGLRLRTVLYQAIALGAVVWAIYYLISNTADNLAARGMQTGFDFLFVTAGFDTDFKLIPYTVGTGTYGRIFLIGILNTLSHY